ncbi:hypothetical protein JW887_06430 [Candidatus Dojkabacteria bacterium]|nr:hypothetical protein [Candidatus Dojkabacteria bacterium]
MKLSKSVQIVTLSVFLGVIGLINPFKNVANAAGGDNFQISACTFNNETKAEVCGEWSQKTLADLNLQSAAGASENYTYKIGEVWHLQKSVISTDGVSIWSTTCTLNTETGQETCGNWEQSLVADLGVSGTVGTYCSYSFFDGDNNWHVAKGMISLDGNTSWTSTCDVDGQGAETCSDWTEVNVSTLGISGSIGACSSYAVSPEENKWIVKKDLVSTDGSTMWSKECELNPDNGAETCGDWVEGSVSVYNSSLAKVGSMTTYTYLNNSSNWIVNRVLVSQVEQEAQTTTAASSSTLTSLPQTAVSPVSMQVFVITGVSLLVIAAAIYVSDVFLSALRFSVNSVKSGAKAVSNGVNKVSSSVSGELRKRQKKSYEKHVIDLVK